ncbi:receptor-type tyrosine-protein phosphatase N2 [Anoplophora glabripennis]|nr:receptor-type tyrosine-protein phosphatase N2 [Anoplophora glabripennis]
MPWPGASLRIAILLLAATVGPPGYSAESNVGCLFSERLCLEEEWCYDDFAFGRCLRTIGDVDEDDLYRYNLEREGLHELSAELRRLFALGYRWSHGYTQCRLQALLYAFKHDMTFEPDACSHLVDNDLEGALKALEGQVQLDPQEVAIIKYTPSVDDPHAAYADEVYYPPVNNKAQETIREKILAPNAIDLDMEDPYAAYSVVKREWIPQMHHRSSPQYQDQPKDPANFPTNRATDSLEFLQRYEQNYPQPNRIINDRPTLLEQNDYLTLEDLTEMYPVIKFLNDMHLTPREIQKFLSPENYMKLRELLAEFDRRAAREDDVQDLLRQQLEADSGYVNSLPQERFTLNYNTPDNFRAGWESRDILPYKDLEDIPESRVYIDEEEGQDDENTEYGSGNSLTPDEEIFRERKTSRNFEVPTEREIFRELERENNDRVFSTRPRPGVYTEGGVVWSPTVDRNFLDATTEHQNRLILKDNLDKLLEKYNLGFKRPERLDVKKPGPPFDAQITESAQKVEKLMHKIDDENTLLPSMMKKEPRGVHPDPEHDPPKHAPEMDYVYVEFKNDFRDWSHGMSIISNISNLLHIEPSAFVEGEASPKWIMFRVKQNSRGLNASEVAKKIDAIKGKLKEVAGVEVYSAGIGDRSRMQTVLTTALNNENQFYIVIFMVCGVLAAMIIATALLILIRRHIKLKEKLQGLNRPDTEASKDYQDLCRSRMAAKGQPPGETVHGRITSLSRESEQSPSSRSSTSSWSEEPALHNMDISTGHMVLSYMEDHLKNKDRLEQEWVALCAYVAEPCETTIALKKENVDKNRYPEIVPYDHARVVLNELSNASGCDYINASSITDHDPRNPAYIATQGPLPHTAPDFWQLIWEQGAVVIVMLTRLTEGGAAMCHRYWPEEGSELYHIYEVHLVSEHIWCDDYLVRSFYLKNVRTGETRTVTQFHFLSWPESGVPASTKALLEFRRKVNKSYRGRSCPIVVHCSDGAGRTGTYCLIDMVLSRMAKGAKEIDIAATLEHLRDQRPRMVATKQQFEFVLTAVAEEVHAILKALPPQPTPAQNQEK